MNVSYMNSYITWYEMQSYMNNLAGNYLNCKKAPQYLNIKYLKFYLSLGVHTHKYSRIGLISWGGGGGVRDVSCQRIFSDVRALKTHSVNGEGGSGGIGTPLCLPCL